jgi:hypothetical protein
MRVLIQTKGLTIKAETPQCALVGWYVVKHRNCKLFIPREEEKFICIMTAAIERLTGKMIEVSTNVTFDYQCKLLLFYLRECGEVNLRFFK